MKKVFVIGAISAIIATISGCASTPTAQYVSPNTYQSYDCNALSSEYNRLTQYLNANKNPSALAMSGIGVGITGGRHGIYPTISFGVGKANSTNNSNIGLALGEKDAIVQSARLKHCSFANSVKLSTEK